MIEANLPCQALLIISTNPTQTDGRRKSTFFMMCGRCETVGAMQLSYLSNMTEPVVRDLSCEFMRRMGCQALGENASLENPNEIN